MVSPSDSKPRLKDSDSKQNFLTLLCAWGTPGDVVKVQILILWVCGGA